VALAYALTDEMEVIDLGRPCAQTVRDRA